MKQENRPLASGEDEELLNRTNNEAGEPSPSFFSGSGFVLLGAILWGTTGTAQALAPEAANPLAIAAIRLTLGCLSLLIFAFFKGALKNIRKLPLVPTIFAAFSLALYQPFFFVGVNMTGVAVGTVVGIGSSPVFAGIIGYFSNREKPSNSWFIATIAAVLGNLLLILSGGNLSLNPWGIGSALLAGFFYASYSHNSKKLLEHNPVETVLAVILSIGAIVLLPLLVTQDLSWLKEVRGIAVALHLGVITVFIAYWSYSQGLSQIPAHNAVTLTLAEPLTAALLGVTLLGERLGQIETLGIMLVFLGILILTIKK